MANSDFIFIWTLANSDLIFIWTLANSDLVFMRSKLASGQGPNRPRSDWTTAEIQIRPELTNIAPGLVITISLHKNMCWDRINAAI